MSRFSFISFFNSDIRFYTNMSHICAHRIPIYLVVTEERLLKIVFLSRVILDDVLFEKKGSLYPQFFVTRKDAFKILYAENIEHPVHLDQTGVSFARKRYSVGNTRSIST